MPSHKFNLDLVEFCSLRPSIIRGTRTSTCRTNGREHTFTYGQCFDQTTYVGAAFRRDNTALGQMPRIALT